MRRLGWMGLFIALAGIGVAAGAFLPASHATIGATHVKKVTHAKRVTHAKKVTIKVTAREFSYSLSKRSVPVGTIVTFKVTNKGKISHNFVVAGKKSKTLNPGQSTTLRVKFSKKGRFKYLCSLPGHAAAGMKGKFAVGVSAVKPPPTTTPSTTTRTTVPPTTTGSVGNAKTTVTVNLVEYAFQMSQTSIPSGQVTFIVNNKGAEVHNFDINGVKSGALLAPGASETWTVSLAPGQYLTTCDVPFHVDRGMTMAFNVTP